MPEQNKKNLILTLETSGRAGSVAIGNGVSDFFEKKFTAPMRHNAELFGTISELLAKTGSNPLDIAEIYVSIGPGSFTGIRIAVTAAKMMSMANSAKIVAVNTTGALAFNANSETEPKTDNITRLGTVIDAKRNHFFTAVFEKMDQNWIKTHPDSLLRADEFIKSVKPETNPIWLLGEGLVYYKDKFKADGVSFLDEKYWSATAAGVYKAGRILASQGKYTDPEKLTPLYLRRSDAEENLAKKQVI